MTWLRSTASWIAEHEFWLMWVYGAPLLLASNIPRWLFALALATVPLFWAARRLARGTWTIVTPLDLPLTLLLFLGLLSLTVSSDRATSLYLYSQWVGLVALYYSVVNIQTQTRFRIAVWVLSGLGLALALAGFLGLNYSEKFLPRLLIYPLLPKFDLTFLNPSGFTGNIVAGAVAPIACITMGLAFAHSRYGRIAAFLIVLVALGVVLLTQSRGAILGLVIAFSVILIWRVRSLSWVVLVIIAVFFGAIVYFGPADSLAFVLFNDSSGSARGRLELWSRALDTFQDFPFTGIGLGTFQQIVPVLYPLLFNDPSAPMPHAHNLYLQMGVDYGIGGLVAFLGLVTSGLVVGVQNVLQSRERKENWLALGLLGGYIVFLVHGLFDVVLVSTKAGIVVWFLIGLMIAFARVERHDADSVKVG